MERETRYIVLKIRDVKAANLTSEEIQLLDAIAAKVDAARQNQGKPPLECVVVEKDWPEYFETWAKIAARVDDVPLLKAKIDQFQKYGDEG